MNHSSHGFEIPPLTWTAPDAPYASVLGVSREHFTVTDMRMAVFEGAQESVRGAPVADKRRQPVVDGALVYLHAPQRDQSLSRVERAGGNVLSPKTNIGDSGFVVLVPDTEGNVVAHHSPR